VKSKPFSGADATQGLQTYLVGGAVRDLLLGRIPEEHDYVVVGASVEDMLARGFRQVGKDFPVFLHPQTQEEYALARTERKTAPGYRGFQVQSHPGVTLEEDLRRRDLTINAMAMDATGRLIDPHGGLADLKARILRHVSPAFVEDPVRILRLARFTAQLADLGFGIAEETLELARAMVAAGEVDALVPERVWQEMARALAADRPARFFEVLRDCGALARLLPELDRLWGVPQPPEWHPEIDTGVHVMLVLDMAARIAPELEVRFAALCHDLGKGVTPPEILPSHHGHEERGLVLVESICDRFRVPNRCRELARLTTAEHGRIHKVEELRAGTILSSSSAPTPSGAPSASNSCWPSARPTFAVAPAMPSAPTPRPRSGVACLPQSLRSIPAPSRAPQASRAGSPSTAVPRGFRRSGVSVRICLESPPCHIRRVPDYLKKH